MATVSRFVAVVTILSCLSVWIQAGEVTVDPSKVLETLDKNHPRLAQRWRT